MTSQSQNSGDSGATGATSGTQNASGASQNQTSQTQSATGATSQTNNQTGSQTGAQAGAQTVDLTPIQTLLTQQGETLKTLTESLEKIRRETSKELAKHRRGIKALADGKKPEGIAEDDDDEGEGEGKGKADTSALEAQINALQTQMTQTQTSLNMQIEVERAAAADGFKFPGDVWALIDKTSIKPDAANPGKFTGIAEAVKKIGERYPALKGGKTVEKPDTNSKTDGTDADKEKRNRGLATRYGI